MTTVRARPRPAFPDRASPGRGARLMPGPSPRPAPGGAARPFAGPDFLPGLRPRSALIPRGSWSATPSAEGTAPMWSAPLVLGTGDRVAAILPEAGR